MVSEKVKQEIQHVKEELVGAEHRAMGKDMPTECAPPPKYMSFVAGVFSGVSKLVTGHPFETIKVRMQTAPDGKFKGPIDCLVKTVRNEGVRGLYKGATPPLVGWMIMDSVMLGSYHNYKRCLKDTIYQDYYELPTLGCAIAGIGAGWTVSFVAAPIEHIKARLQVQYDAKTKLYTGPINCAKQLISQGGIAGLYKGLFSTMLFRTNFFFWWGSYDLITKQLKKRTDMSLPTINFWAGGFSATIFWVTAFPYDVVKQQIMTDSVVNPKYPTWWSACKSVYQRWGWKGYFRGFMPSFIRSFPTNAIALVVFEATMRVLQ